MTAVATGPTPAEMVKSWLRQNGIADVQSLPKKVTIEFADGRAREEKFHLYLPKQNVYLVATSHRQDDRSQKARRQLGDFRRLINYAHCQGVGCLYVEGCLLEGLLQGKRSSRDKFLERLSRQRKLAAGEGPTPKVLQKSKRGRRQSAPRRRQWQTAPQRV